MSRWAFGIDPRLHSRDVTVRQDRMGRDGRRDKAGGLGRSGANVDTRAVPRGV